MSAQTQPPDSLLADLPIPMNDDDSNDAPIVAYLTPLSDDDVSRLLRALIPLLSNWRRDALHSHLLRRLAHASPTSALTTALATILSAQADASSTNPRTHANIALNHLVQSLPLRALPPYIPALTHLSNPPSSTPDNAARIAAAWTASTATAVLRLAAGDVWTPENKFDHLAIRSLHAGARSPALMAPFVPDLLRWLQDYHWPVYAACAAQLARFPDVAAEGARHVLRVQGQGDDEWMRNVVNFVAEDLPGEVREGCRGAVVEVLEEVEARVREMGEAEEADEFELREACRECLEVMDWWMGRERVLGRVGWWLPKEELVDEDEDELW
ncbi:hypothetical protein DIS24_g8520 [Lasiodiplodia hormozganensis]|uniref:DUF5071 domain-containing protein n=1 Tax=Lasiodiplodia hormozganensis TaxID=869390 RepID=A0AA39Y2I2_9PEZI|nr:hypothetical protein DIS24_g8520 [Lasiodiplodia hormozganensis]